MKSASQHMTVREVASRLGVSRQTLYAWVATRRIGHTRIGRTVRIPTSEVERLIEAGTVRAVEG